MSKPIRLRGVTWNHSRGLIPLVATAQRFVELHPNWEISWSKRSLHEFGHAGLDRLASEFDLLVVDHPMMGEALEEGCLLDLHSLLPARHLEELAADSAGPSFNSYRLDGRLYAVPIDAATPVASYRPDLLANAGLEVPPTTAGVLSLAARGLVIMPAFPADLFLNFVGLCASLGSGIAATGEQFVEHAQHAYEALELLRDLTASMPSEIFAWNPIAVYEELAAGDKYLYCPFAYSYSNYAREGYAAHRLRFTDPPSWQNSTPIRTALGGTGLAISKNCQALEAALAYTNYVTGAACQRSLYGMNGGQPARKTAWLDPALNGISLNFFMDTLPAMDRAYVRPRYNGYIGLQERAGIPIAEYLRHGVGSPAQVLARIDSLYRQSLRQSNRTHA